MTCPWNPVRYANRVRIGEREKRKGGGGTNKTNWLKHITHASLPTWFLSTGKYSLLMTCAWAGLPSGPQHTGDRSIQLPLSLHRLFLYIYFLRRRNQMLKKGTPLPNILKRKKNQGNRNLLNMRIVIGWLGLRRWPSFLATQYSL